jgi:CitB family two-component system response regulator MalR
MREMLRPILLIEDDPHDVILVRDTLAQLNLVNDIDVATTADAARMYVKQRMPALIISDIYLPGETGIDFLHWLREQSPPLGSVPVIMMSVSTDAMHHMRASALRALLFMTKPIKQEVLLDQLRGLGLLVTHIPQGEQPGLMIEYRTH